MLLWFGYWSLQIIFIIDVVSVSIFLSMAVVVVYWSSYKTSYRVLLDLVYSVVLDVDRYKNHQAPFQFLFLQNIKNIAAFSYTSY